MDHHNFNIFRSMSNPYSHPPSASIHNNQWPNQTPSNSRLSLFKHRLNTYVHNNQSAPRPAFSSKANPINTNVRLSDVKNDFKQAFSVIDEIKQETQQLHLKIDQLPEQEWLTSIEHMQRKQLELQLLTEKYKCPNLRDAIHQKASKLAKKRLNIRKRKEATRQFKKQSEEQRVAKHAEIDEWQHHQQQESFEHRRKADDSKCAQHILDAMVRKKLEATQYIKLLDSLVELRRVRSIQSGRNDTGQKEFVAKIERLRNVWADAKLNYEIEARELQNHVNPNGSLEDEWCQALFGCDKTMLSGQTKNARDLLRNRRLWDKCLVSHDHPFGSAVPVGWITPNSNASEEWTKYRLLNAESSN